MNHLTVQFLETILRQVKGTVPLWKGCQINPNCMSQCWGRSSRYAGNFPPKSICVLARYWGLKFCFNIGLVTSFRLCFLFIYTNIFTADDFCLFLPWLMLRASRPYLWAEMWGNVTINKVKRRQLTFFVWSVNFELEYFPSEETEGDVTDTVMNSQDWHLTWLSQLKPND